MLHRGEPRKVSAVATPDVAVADARSDVQALRAGHLLRRLGSVLAHPLIRKRQADRRVRRGTAWIGAAPKRCARIVVVHEMPRQVIEQRGHIVRLPPLAEGQPLDGRRPNPAETGSGQQSFYLQPAARPGVRTGEDEQQSCPFLESR